MGFTCGIVGLPNVGKSTLFNALTSGNAMVANFPFCTIEPNAGRVAVPDPRLDALAAIVQPKRVLPTFMEFVDIAGLVRGASAGEGLGNQFLSHIRQVDAVIHVVRGFSDCDIVHVEGRLHPEADIDLLNLELALADLQSAQRQRERLKRSKQPSDKLISALETLIHQLSEGRSVRESTLSTEQRVLVSTLDFITAKPMLYVLNVDEGQTPAATLQERIKAEVIALSALFEAELVQLPLEERADFLSSMSMQDAALPRLIRAGEKLLQRQTFFTAGVQEVRAWSIPRGCCAPAAAGKIHSDFEKGFIRAEVIGYNDYIACNGEAGAKTAGKWRLEGKEYVLQEGDVVHFRHNV